MYLYFSHLKRKNLPSRPFTGLNASTSARLLVLANKLCDICVFFIFIVDSILFLGDEVVGGGVLGIIGSLSGKLTTRCCGCSFSGVSGAKGCCCCVFI